MREAVAAILVHGEDIYITRRQEHLRAFPGYYAFPGGKIEPGDRGRAPYRHPVLAGHPAPQMSALIRELEEELGYDLEGAVEQGEVEQISEFGIAETPAFEAVRYRAHYFKIVVRTRPALHPAGEEIAWGDWLHRDVLHEHYLDGGLMVVPTANTILALAEEISAVCPEEFNLVYDEARELPYIELINGMGFFPVPSRTLPPARYTNAYIVGDGVGEPRYLVDPAPESDAVFEKLIAALASRPVDGILITHHHPDHHERCPALARRLGLPVHCSRVTEGRLKARFGADYLDGVEIRRVEAGDRLTGWRGRDVICRALPGHDDGMIGFAPEDLAWFFVADLVEPLTTVVIPEPEGDMGDYFDTLARLIEMDPKVIVPSHGMPMGGTYLLRRTLQHRIDREREVASLHGQGLGVEAILGRLYAGLDTRLVPLARQNIRQHMRKLGISVA